MDEEILNAFLEGSDDDGADASAVPRVSARTAMDALEQVKLHEMQDLRGSPQTMEMLLELMRKLEVRNKEDNMSKKQSTLDQFFQ